MNDKKKPFNIELPATHTRPYAPFGDSKPIEQFRKDRDAPNGKLEATSGATPPPFTIEENWVPFETWLKKMMDRQPEIQATTTGAVPKMPGQTHGAMPKLKTPKPPGSGSPQNG